MLRATLARTVALFRNRAAVLFTVAAAVYVPTDLVFAAVDDTRAWGDVTIERLLAGLAIYSFAAICAYGTCIALLGSSSMGILGALGVLAQRFATLAVVTLVLFVGILVGFLALVVPGILLLVWWWVSYQTVVLEGAPWRKALGRSRELARGHFWPILLVALCVCGGYVLAEYVLVWLLGRSWLPDFWSAWVMGALTDTLMVPLSATVTTALYVELRRSEASRSA